MVSESSPNLSRRVALVTGASSGLGAEIARVLVSRGVGRVVLVARRADRLEQLSSELGASAEVALADLTRPSDLDGLVAAFPAIDLLVNNAGAGCEGRFAERAASARGDLSGLVDLNCRALIHLTGSWIPGMIERGRGWVLNVGSIGGMFPTPTFATYGATKAFVNHFTESLRIELRPTGVRVGLLAPGPLATEFFGDARHERPGLSALWVPPRRAAEVAVSGLLNDRAVMIPGLLVRLAAFFARSIPRPVFRAVASHALQRQSGESP